MIIYPKKMISNLNITKGIIFSQEIMLELTKTGISREKSYRIIQTHANKCLDQNLNLVEVVKKDKLITDIIPLNKLKKIFNYSSHFKNINLIYNRVFK
jgi:adenylosuccinate lyase